MSQKVLARYLISEILPPLCVGLVAFTLILLIARILKLIELVMTRGVPVLQIAKLFGLILPTFLELTVPMAFLLAVLLGLGRLANDHEMLAMKASGISPMQILRPVIATAAIIGIITLVLTIFARPAANIALKRELYNIAKSRIGTAIKEKVFNDDFPKILIYVEEMIPPGNTAQGILIVDKRNSAKDDVIVGRIAVITTDEESNTLGLKLFDGSIYEKEKNRPGFSQTRFNIYDFKLDLDEITGAIKKKEPAPKEISFRRLSRIIGEQRAKGSPAIPERMEYHQRLSFGFVPIVFGLLGVSLALLPRGSRANRSWGFMLCLFWLLIYYALLSLGKALGDKGILHPFLATWFSNAAVGAIAVHFFRKAFRESPLLLQTIVERWQMTVQQYVTALRLRQRG